MSFKDDGITDPRVYDTILKQMIDSRRYGSWLIWDANDACHRSDQDRSGGRPSAERASVYKRPVGWHGHILAPRTAWEMLRDNVPTEILQSDLYRVPREHDLPYLLEPHLIEAASGDPTLVTSLSKPLKHDGRIVGVLAIDIKLDAMADALQAIELPAGATMNVLSEGGIVAMSSDGTHLGSLIGSASRDMQRIFERAKGGNGSESRSGPNGKVVRTTWSQISFAGTKNPWYLIVTMPERSLLAASSDGRTFLWLVAFAAMLTVLALVFATMDRLVALPLKRLSTVIDGLGEGLFGYVVPSKRPPG